MGGWFSAADAVEVIPGLWIGSAPTTRTARQLARAGITAVVDLTENDAAAAWPSEISVHHRPLLEYQAPSRADLEAISSEIASLLASGHTVLVHCRAGVQRAPMIACAALVAMGWPLSGAVDLVRARRVAAAMSEAQLAALVELAAEAQRSTPDRRAATA